MKFVIRDDHPIDQLHFYLQDQDGEIVLCAKERNGTSWNIVQITRDGFLERFVGIRSGLGLALEKNGIVKLID